MHPHRLIFLHWALAAIGLSLLATPSFGAEGAKRPNLIVILADDLGINDLSCYGRAEQPTPNLDRLAREGMRFTNAYASQCVCSPTRAALMTGLTPARLHLTAYLPGRPDAASQLLLQPRINLELPRDARTIAERIKGSGYATGYFGKWHLGGQGHLPTDRGFDVYKPGQAKTTPSANEGGKGEYGLTAQAEKFIEERKEKPFLLYVAHDTPHIPLAAKVELIEKHKKTFNPIYGGMIESLDDCVGRLVAKVDALGLRERTLIIFTSDNGGLHVPEGANTPSTHNSPYRAGKGFLYEGGLRIPLIARWPGKVKAGVESSGPVISADWPPTFMSLMGIEIPGGLDGVSLAGLLTKNEPLAPRPLYWHAPHYTNQGGRPAGAIRLGDWKLIEHYEDGKCELFNLANDPGETTDRSAQEPGVIADLRGKLEKWRREVKAQENTGNPKFNPAAWRRLYRDLDPSLVPGGATAEVVGAKFGSWRAAMNDALPKAGPEGRPGALPGPGAIFLHARSVKVHGVKLHFEPEPHKDTLGYWVQRDDWAEWEFESPGSGTFAVEILQGCGKGSGGAEVELVIGDHKVTFKVEETGHFQRFVPRTVGTVKLKENERYKLIVRAKTKPGPAVMDIRQIVLRGE